MCVTNFAASQHAVLPSTLENGGRFGGTGFWWPFCGRFLAGFFGAGRPFRVCQAVRGRNALHGLLGPSYGRIFKRAWRSHARLSCRRGEWTDAEGANAQAQSARVSERKQLKFIFVSITYV
jgi:hypothetical protein